jgi:hypothetical protein
MYIVTLIALSLIDCNVTGVHLIYLKLLTVNVLRFGTSMSGLALQLQNRLESQLCKERAVKMNYLWA